MAVNLQDGVQDVYSQTPWDTCHRSFGCPQCTALESLVYQQIASE